MKIIEHIKTVLFIGLFVGAVAMAGIYIAVQPRTSAGSDLPADVLSALQGNPEGAADSLADDQLLPVFLGIKQAGKQAVGLLHSAAMVRDLNEALSPWLAFSLGQGASAAPLRADEADAYWRNCLSADAYFYLSWRFAVPAAVLRAHALPEQGDAMLTLAGSDLPRIAEMFFFPDLRGADICAVSRDDAGGVTIWRRTPGEEDALPGFGDFDIYLDRGVLQTYRFYGTAYADVPPVQLSLPVPTNALILPELVQAYPFAGTEADTRVPEAILEIMAYNPNKSSGYYEADTDTAVYVETHGTLRASAHSLLYEAAAAGGLSVADLTGKSVSGLNLRDDIVACEALVERLRQAAPQCIGGDAVPQLIAVGTRSSSLVLTYAYAYDNVTIEQEYPAVQLEVADHRIVRVSLAVCRYAAAETDSRAGSQQWMLNLADYLRRNRDTEACAVNLCYAPGPDAQYLRADWTLTLLD